MQKISRKTLELVLKSFEGILSNIELQEDVDFVTDVEGYSDEEKERFEELLQNYELTYRRY